MKCICGYKHGWIWINDEHIEVKGEHGEFRQSHLELPLTQGDYYSSYISMKTIYICPQCGTLRVEL